MQHEHAPNALVPVIDVARIFLDGYIRPWVTVVPGPMGPMVFKGANLALYLGPQLASWGPNQVLGLYWASDTSKELS